MVDILSSAVHVRYVFRKLGYVNSNGTQSECNEELEIGVRKSHSFSSSASYWNNAIGTHITHVVDISTLFRILKIINKKNDTRNVLLVLGAPINVDFDSRYIISGGNKSISR